MRPKWRTMADVLTYMRQVREWERHHDDVQVTALIRQWGAR